MSELLIPITIDQQISAVEREIKRRKCVYPLGWTTAERKKQRMADWELATMRSVLDTLRQVRAGMAIPGNGED